MRPGPKGDSSPLKTVLSIVSVVVIAAVMLFVFISKPTKAGDEPPAAQSAAVSGTEDGGNKTIAGTTPETSPDITPEATDKGTDVVSVTEDAQDSNIFILSFAGDCTLGTAYETYGKTGTFIQVVGDNYSYPLANAAEYFLYDDFTMVNLEGALTNHNMPVEKTYRFRGPPEYAAILTAGGVDCVSLANNHTGDYGKTGREDTKTALDDAGVSYAADGEYMVFETERGLKIGVFASFSKDDKLKGAISAMREEGAQIIIVSFHFGEEGNYRPTSSQKSRARHAVDLGADIVFGHHPHVLQPVEKYNDGVIYYSLGNFSFGGNRNPADKDTAVIQQYIEIGEDGSASLSDTVIIPFSISSDPSYNDYCPTPYVPGTREYDRTLSKLDGTYSPPPKPSPSPSEEPATSGESPAENGGETTPQPTGGSAGTDNPGEGG